MSDFFHEAADGWREEAWDVVRSTPRHTYQVLTKRPERIAECLPADWGEGWPNVWLGTSVESQRFLDRVPHLARIPAPVRFVSAEPLLGSLDLEVWLQYDFVQWVIVGGESDPSDPRPMKARWARRIRDACREWGVPFFFKQWGGRSKVDGVWGGRVLDGRTYDGIPEVPA